MPVTARRYVLQMATSGEITLTDHDRPAGADYMGAWFYQCRCLECTAADPGRVKPKEAAGRT